MSPLTTTPHEPTEACLPVHCHSHHIDEPAEPSYIWCYECGHVYRTARALWWAHLRAALRLARRDLRRPLNPPWWAELGIPRWQRGRTAAVLMAVRAVFQPARRVAFCQECLHDF